MRKTTSAILALCALVALAGRADDPEPDKTKEELKRLKGTWTVTRWVSKKRELRGTPVMTYTFDGDKVTKESPAGKGKTLKATFKVKIDAKKKPYRIELVPDGTSVTLAGIYKIEQGELYLAVGGVQIEAPKDFNGDTRPVYVMTRKKEKK
jgi:uncharacterized protein (TIGR03067 family)